MPNFIKKYTGSLIAWIVVVILSVVFLPNMSNLVAQKGQTKIPATSQSQVAETIKSIGVMVLVIPWIQLLSSTTVIVKSLQVTKRKSMLQFKN